MVNLRRSLPATETNRVSKCSLTTVYAVIVGPSNICSFSFFFVLFPCFSHVTSATTIFFFWQKKKKESNYRVYAMQGHCKTKPRFGYGLCLQFEDPRSIYTRRWKLCVKREGLWHQTACSVQWHHVSKTSFGVSTATSQLPFAALGVCLTMLGMVMETKNLLNGMLGWGESIAGLGRGGEGGRSSHHKKFLRIYERICELSRKRSAVANSDSRCARLGRARWPQPRTWDGV